MEILSCTKILKTSNIEELRRGLVKTLRGLSIAVSDNRLSAELLIPSTLPQANYVLLIFFLISIIIINHLTSFSPTTYSSSSSSSPSPSPCFINLFQTQTQISLYTSSFGLLRGNLRSSQFCLACCVCSEEQGSLWCGAIRELGPPDYQHNCARSHRSTLHIFLPHVLQKHIYI